MIDGLCAEVDREYGREWSFQLQLLHITSRWGKKKINIRNKPSNHSRVIPYSRSILIKETDLDCRPPVGPFIMGFVIQHLDWRWMFWIMAIVSESRISFVF